MISDTRNPLAKRRARLMNLLVIIIAVVAVILLITGGLVESLQFLLWVGVVLAVIAVIVFLLRMISGRKV
jgi:drug/metabolite transporter (DMT)-like permease